MGAEEEPEQVDVDHPLRLVDLGALDQAEQHHPGVVDEAVEPVELDHGGRDQAPRLLLVGNVRLDRAGAAGLALDPRGDLLEPVLASAGPCARPSATAAPSRAIAGAIASPMPEEAPVIRALRG